MAALKKITNMFKKKPKSEPKENPPPPSKPKKKNNVSTFIKYVVMLIIGYKIYYFNLNLEYYFKNIDYNKTKNIFLTGGNINKLSEETFKDMFGSEINETITNNLKYSKDGGWFSNYIFNLKLDFCYYFLKLMNIINKLKLTRYFVVSLLLGGVLFTLIMGLMYFITAFFSVYGLVRVFTMNLPFYIFAILVPFLFMPFITTFILIYYTIKLLFLDTKLPNGKEKPTIKGLEWDKLVIVSFIITYISSRIPHLSNNVVLLKSVTTFISLLVPFIFTWKHDFFFVKDKYTIINALKSNKQNLMYLVFFIICIVLFSKYS